MHNGKLSKRLWLLLISAALSGCASAPVGLCQGGAAYTAARALGYPTFLLVIGFTGNACSNALKDEEKQ